MRLQGARRIESLKENEKFIKTHGALITDLKVDTVSQKLFNLHFMVRRLLYLSIALNFINVVSSLQIVILMLTNTASLVYLGLSEAQETRTDKRLVLYNEFVVGLSC